MICKNCGWDNPSGKVRCLKCNAPLKGSMVDDGTLHQENETAGKNPPKTTLGCPFPDCGYPLKPDDVVCPSCGRATDNKEKKPRLDDTIMISFNVRADNGIAESKKLAGFLVTYSHAPKGEFFPLYEGKNSIGRNATNDIVIPDNAVSGEHLTIVYYRQNKKFYFDTVGLTQNGTYVNDKFYPKGGDELMNNDVITIGATRLFFIAIPEGAFQ